MEESKIEIFERNRLAELKSRLFVYEQTMKDERRKLWQIGNESEKEQTVWRELEPLTTYIYGYVSQIVIKGYTRQEPDEVISHLHNLSIFNLDCIMKWYPTAAQEYPKIKHYFELLDYVRLLTIDYIQRYLLQEPQQNEENEFTTFAS